VGELERQRPDLDGGALVNLTGVAEGISNFGHLLNVPARPICRLDEGAYLISRSNDIDWVGGVQHLDGFG
jgi:hypothetical protein